LAKLPERERERVRITYWQALDQAESIADGERRMRALIGELDRAGYASAAACLVDDLGALLVHLSATRNATTANGAARTCSSAHSARSAGAPR
jgi:hypothetical protein